MSEKISQIQINADVRDIEDAQALHKGDSLGTINGQSFNEGNDLNIEVGTNDYNALKNKPQINGHELSGNKSAKDLGLQEAGDYVTPEDIPDVSELATKTELAEGLEGKQPKGDYATKAEIPDVSGFITSSQAEEKYQPKGTYVTTTELSKKADKIATENVAEDTKELQPNKYYIFGEVATLTITLAAGEENVLAEYMFEFTSGTTPTTLSLPEGIKWIGESTIEASKTYQVSIVNNIAVMGGAA